MKLKTIIYSLFVLLFLMGCKKEPLYEIYENHVITSCGIVDPLKNIEWLKQYCLNNVKAYNADIYIYENTETKENYIVTYALSKGEEYTQIHVFSCSNELLFHWNTATPPSPLYDAFFSNKKVISKIWSVREISEP
jgi:hypothetical protein